MKHANGARKIATIRFIAPVGSVGGGISEPALAEALVEAPHFIACDGAPPTLVPFLWEWEFPLFPRRL